MKTSSEGAGLTLGPGEHDPKNQEGGDEGGKDCDGLGRHVMLQVLNPDIITIASRPTLT